MQHLRAFRLLTRWQNNRSLTKRVKILAMRGFASTAMTFLKCGISNTIILKIFDKIELDSRMEWVLMLLCCIAQHEFPGHSTKSPTPTCRSYGRKSIGVIGDVHPPLARPIVQLALRSVLYDECCADGMQRGRSGSKIDDNHYPYNMELAAEKAGLEKPMWMRGPK